MTTQTVGGWATEQLAEFLGAVSSSTGRRSAVNVAIQRAAEAIDAEVAAVVTSGTVEAAVGFGDSVVPDAALVDAANGRTSSVDVPGAGACATVAAPLDDVGSTSTLVLARSGGAFTPEERILLRAMARTLGLTLRTMNRTREEMRAALHDTLTGFANRALFVDRLLHALTAAERHGTNVAVLYLDLDRFKVVNDSLGHAAGDEVLIAVARRIKGAIRDLDTPARLGGDEFAILVEDVPSVSAATVVADRILHSLKSPFIVWGKEFQIAASVGIAISDGTTQKPADLIRDADLAMYRAKAHAQGGYAVFERSMRAQLVERLDLEENLRSADQRREFRVHYQPIVRADGGLKGFEALVRWQHPVLGLLAPAQFLQVAEEAGLIAEIGWTVLDQACRDMAGWVSGGRGPLDLNVNFAASQIAQADCTERVMGTLERTGLAPERLIIELTETVLMQDSEAVVARLTQLHARGVRFAVDDFGLGYSSLRYLLRFPIDVIKIPKPFIDRLATGGRDAVIASAIVQFARSLGIPTVAEGIERQAELDVLHELGCPAFQGFLFARPMTAGAVSALVGNASKHSGVVALPVGADVVARSDSLAAEAPAPSFL
ncbi:MAG TPA: bifunctional diguanylate cyclase/phosphodiesterase [Patescibacteria group bacterium]|nr:bifunctional diguanylate cyclase/phosphodiesterase [Patescibacteria group bacterium]